MGEAVKCYQYRKDDDFCFMYFTNNNVNFKSKDEDEDLFFVETPKYWITPEVKKYKGQPQFDKLDNPGKFI